MSRGERRELGACLVFLSLIIEGPSIKGVIAICIAGIAAILWTIGE